MRSSLLARLFAVLVLVLLTVGCRTNLLPEYAGKITATQAQVRVPTIGHVRVATGRQTSKKQSAIEKAANTAIGVAAMNAAYSAELKLREAMPPERVVRIVSKEVAAGARGVGIPFVNQGDAANTQLNVEVRSYGIEAPGDLSPATARFHMYGYLTYLPEGKLIWEYSVFVDIPLSSVHVASTGSNIAGDISNVVAIANLDRRDIRRLFSQATRIATQRFMMMLTNDYQVGRSKYAAKYGADSVAKPPPPAAPPPETDDDDEDEDDVPAAPVNVPPPPPPPPPPGPSDNPDEI
ncbi:MAG: hypothetical protein R3B70_08350 [Polyangiaceae bacterium]